MENVFNFRDDLIREYGSFSRSFSKIAAPDIQGLVEAEYAQGRYWPDPLIQINPNYRRNKTVQQLVAEGVLHSGCAELFKVNKTDGKPVDLFLYAHQMEALAKAGQNKSYVVTTGTGSGKSLSFFIPIIDRILKAKQIDDKPRTRAIVIYPMNALANSQLEELGKFLHGYQPGHAPFTVERYTGQESASERERIKNNPPDILLTNFMMLELILTRFEEVDRGVVDHCQGLEFLVLDELHTYRGRQGADVALLVRRLRERLKADKLVCIGTSATMSSTGSQTDRNKTVSAVASKLFGTPITEHDVIGETLERVTNHAKDVEFVKPFLKAALSQSLFAWPQYADFQDDPLAIWVELKLGIEMSGLEAPRRARPITLKAAAAALAVDASCDELLAREGLQKFLLAAHEVKTEQGRPPFAFKLHQFISGPGKVLTTLEPQGKRFITLDAQRFAPGRQSEGVRLYPVHFCRECGQEYHPVWRSSGTQQEFSPREIDDISSEEDEDAGFGFLCPQVQGLSYGGSLEDLPEAWLDLSKSEPKVKNSFRKAVPQPFSLRPDGLHGFGGQDYWFIPGKFRFCLKCNLTHEVHGKDINRLASLSGEGRSSATTILTLTAIRQLFRAGEPQSGLPDPRKLLGFTDNRQDAALQAGHFNDFIFLLTLRSALMGALQLNKGLLSEDNLPAEVFKSLGFDVADVGARSEYLKNPNVMGLAVQDAQKTLRFILGYRLIRDLRRGWRYNNPNLDQLNLLRIKYRGLGEFADEGSLFQSNPVLNQLLPHHRTELASLLFDYMRRALCLQTMYLDSVEQERAKAMAFQHLNERWSFGADEDLFTANFLILGKRPEYKGKGKPRNDLVPGGSRTRLLKSIKQCVFWKHVSSGATVSSWKDPQWVELIEDLLKAAANYGYVQKFDVDSHVLGWRLNASCMDWSLVADQEIAPDNQHNDYFRNLYLTVAQTLQQSQHALFSFEAQEHTAQVDASRRQILEQRFRYTKSDREEWAKNPAHETPLQRLPIMFCSPTMELGVDISALNAVYLRNVPPTPANYAQRSGRAGRSGMQALVITYCAALSPHDQWFFHHSTDMVHGIVKPPTLDLANQDLVESHLHAIWLAAAQVQLDTSIAPLLDLEQPGQPLKADLQKVINSPEVNQRANQSAHEFMLQLQTDVQGSPWFTPDHAQKTIDRASHDFSKSFERWRSLVEATRQQMDMANSISQSFTSSNSEKVNAQRRYGDAAKQYAMLLKTGNAQNNDFYTYRYLASQGFLPGYNFPRLPLMAWIPAKGGGKDDDGNMVSRPRFLALSEFGPRSLIYHQGRMYRVVRAKLNVGHADHISGNSQLATLTSRVCSACGYAHMGQVGGSEPIVDRCDNCDALLTDKDWVKNLYRIETVETVPVERISINDEDRQRQGFELQTTYRFLPGSDGRMAKVKTWVTNSQDPQASPLAELTYAPAALIWRINRGWRRRKDKNQLGFYINPVSGQWSKKDEPGAVEVGVAEDNFLDKVPNQQIVPYVEDYRNILILQPVAQGLDKETMATLQAALKRGIEMTYQIEESELVAEPLPTQDNRLAIMFYEAAEGGAGVLTRLASDPDALSRVAAQALVLLHHKTPNEAWKLEDLPSLELKDKNGNNICEAGCYQCLLSYFNQPDHDYINRRNEAALKLLVAMANAQVVAFPERDPNLPTTLAVEVPSSQLHQHWLQALQLGGFLMPDEEHVSVAQGKASASGLYKQARVLVFLDALDTEVIQHLQDKGRTVLVMNKPTEWLHQFNAHPEVFGTGNS
jgi:Lhr-like helicase